MRILSSFHDYYDGVQRMAFDDSIKYIRTPLEIELPSNDSDTKLLLSKLSRFQDFEFETLGIGFCGTIYPLIRYKDKCYYTVDEMEDVLKKYDPYKRKRFAKFLTSFECREPFINKGSPIVVLFEKVDFLGIKHKVIWNARLKDYGFQRIVDPYQAFQQIEIFLSNQAVPQIPMPKMSDNQKRDSHGFDNWSFKKR